MSNLKTKNLTKDFGGGKGAIDINLDIQPGEVVGFIGPNGAGKTTTMRLIMGLAMKDRGTVELLGTQINSAADLIDLQIKIGFLPGEVSYYPSYTPLQLMAYASKLYKQNITEAALDIADLLQLDVNKKFSKLSMGNKQKLGLALALAHKPELVIMDEPTSGLDPLVQQKVLALISDAKGRGSSIFLSSHVLSEVQQVCDRIVMIKDAHIVLSDTTENVLSKAHRRFRVPSLPKKVQQEIEKIDGVRNLSRNNIETIFYIDYPQPVIKLLIKHKIYNFYLERPTLEEMFIGQYK